jgi:DNA-binding response OmpR family regulator
MTETTKQQVLLVEDDQDLAKMVADFLGPRGYHVSIEGRGDQAVQRINAESFDVLILDVNLPGMDGFSICRTVRHSFTGPILILTANDDEMNEVIGLEIGADDYMTKPVRPHVLLARLRTQLRKPAAVDPDASGSYITVSGLVIDASRRAVELDGTTIDMTTAEFDLLWLLAENVGQVISRDTIYQTLNGLPYDGLDRSIDLRISRLRKKLGDDPQHPARIKSIRGVGYLFAAD